MTAKRFLEVLAILMLTASPSWAATIAQDTFTELLDVDLLDHTPDTGTGWDTDTQADLDVFGLLTDNVGVASGSTNIRAARETTTIGDDDMDVTLDCVLNSVATNNSGGPTGRIPDTVNGSANRYQAKLVGDATTVDVELEKVVASTTTSLGTYDLNAASTDTVTLKLEIRTAAKKVYVGGVERISSVDDSLTGNNFSGIGVLRSNFRGDNYLSEDAAAAATRRVILISSIKSFLSSLLPSVYADDGLTIGYYRSDVIGDGSEINPRRPKDIPAGAKGWVLLYDHGDEMEYKVLADPLIHATMPVTSIKTKLTLSKQCRDVITQKGEAKIDGR